MKAIALAVALLTFGAVQAQEASTVYLLSTITTDNGCEFAAHLEITRLLSIKGRDKVIV